MITPIEHAIAETGLTISSKCLFQKTRFSHLFSFSLNSLFTSSLSMFSVLRFPQSYSPVLSSLSSLNIILPCFPCLSPPSCSLSLSLSLFSSRLLSSFSYFLSFILFNAFFFSSILLLEYFLQFYIFCFHSSLFLLLFSSIASPILISSFLSFLFRSSLRLIFPFTKFFTLLSPSSPSLSSHLFSLLSSLFSSPNHHHHNKHTHTASYVSPPLMPQLTQPHPTQPHFYHLST